jgi:hypothetical protein
VVRILASHAAYRGSVGIPMKSAAYSDGSRPLIPIDVGHPLRGAPLGEDNVSHGFVCVNLRAQLAY